MLYEFQLGHLATDAVRNICGAIHQGSPISLATAYRWFDRFEKKNYELDDEPRSGRPCELDLDNLKELIENDPRQTTRCF